MKMTEPILMSTLWRNRRISCWSLSKSLWSYMRPTAARNMFILRVPAEPTDTVSFATGQTEYTSHAAQAPAGCENTWQFQGWLLARNRVLLPAVHTVTYDKGTNTLTFSGNGTNISTGEAVSSTMVTGGATLVAQWKWRQRFITQVQNGSSFVDDRGCGQVTVDGSSANGNDIATDYYADTGERVSATARANDGYCFIGWYQQIDQWNPISWSARGNAPLYGGA